MGTTVSKEEKLENLKNYLKELGSVAIAFSSGVELFGNQFIGVIAVEQPCP